MGSDRPARRLLWSDEFDEPAGSPPDPSSWTFELGAGGWGNGELQRYTDEVANAAQDGLGSLVVTARSLPSGGFTSARIISKGSVELRYGRIETRVRVPAGAGLWAAIWALGADIDSVAWPDCGEIDIVEQLGREPHRVFGTIHGPGFAGANGFSGASELRWPVSDGFHVFAVEWRRQLIEWSVDDHAYHSATPADVPGPWVFDHPFYLLINLAVGGDLGGPVADETRFPASLLVDYIRLYA
jgi:beta-glucanase (GH16 family)